MKYQQPTFTLPTVNKSMTQTDYEIAVGLRNPDGSLVPLKPVKKRSAIGDRIAEALGVK